MKPIIIAGPCLAESLTLMEDVAAELQEGLSGIDIEFYFKASFDKANRTDVKAARGPGLRLGLEYLSAIKHKFNVHTLTDVHESYQCDAVAEDVDVLQIPAGLCRQTSLLGAAGRSARRMSRKINIKKGTSFHPAHMAKSAEKIGEGVETWLCERGSSFGMGDLVVDMRGLQIMASVGRPVIFDCTHSTNKQSIYAPTLARAAAATGYVDGLFLEVHPNPRKALCDGPCMLTPAQAINTIKEFVNLYKLYRGN